MKICFIGLGSIAKRHIKNLKELYPDSSIDVLRHSKNNSLPDVVKKYIHNIFTDFSEVKNYDAIFITNPTSLHYNTLKRLINHSNNFFIEKPVFETGEEDINNLNLKKDALYYVACPLRYTNVIKYLKENISCNKVYSVRAISSSYLPEWRLGIDYRNTYSAKKALGGGVAIDLIHEWDYLFFLFGMPNSVYSITAQKSNLEIDSDDIAVYIAEYNSLIVELHLDYFGRVPIRKLELFCEDDIIECDLIKQKLEYKKANRTINLIEDRDSYQKKELIHFFSIVDKKIPNDSTIEKACKILRLARGKIL